MGRHDGHFIGWNAHFRGEYEPETLAVICDLVGQGMRIIEVGANQGYHTVFAGWCAGPSGLVHAYEPYVHARAWLERNVARLGWGSRVRVHSAAVGARASGSATLFVPAESAENQGVAGLRISSELQTGQALVDVVILDAEHDTETIAFIKMDVQGGEAEVIHGAERLLRRCQPALYFEVGDGGLMTAIPAAEEHGYVVQRVFPFSRKPFYSLSEDIAGRWYGNCLAIHRDRLEEFEATRKGRTALGRGAVGSRTETLETGHEDPDCRHDQLYESGQPLLSFVPRQSGAQVTYFDEAPYLKPLHTSLTHKMMYRVLGRRPATAWALNGRLLEVAAECRPDVVIVAKGAYVFPKTLRRLKALGARLVNYATDDPFNTRSADGWLRSAIPEYDLYACTKRAIESDVRAAGCKRTAFVRFGYDPTCTFRTCRTAGEVNGFSSDVVFVGGADEDRLPYWMPAVHSRVEACPLWWLLGSTAASLPAASRADSCRRRATAGP